MKRIFSGVQPSGNLHIGNYIGALQSWNKMQDDYESMFCVVDLHAITVSQDPRVLREKILEIAKIYIASGIDPEKSIIFVQSDVQEHAELAWVLNTISKISELERMTQFKDKAKKQKQNVNMGLFDYPVLMAADILLYNTDVVPVGHDQLQHIELARTLAKRFNTQFEEVFTVPEPFVPKAGARIMGLDDPEAKMSKSSDNPNNYIGLLDDEKTIRKKIAKAVTDPGSEIKMSKDKPGVSNLLTILSAISGKGIKEMEKDFQGKSYKDLKDQLADELLKFLSPFQERFNSLDDEQIKKILKENAEKASIIASATMSKVKSAVGFGL